MAAFTVSSAPALFLAGYAFAEVTKLRSPTPAVGSLFDFIVVILGIIIKISIPALTVFFIYAGFLFVSAQGNEKKLAEAKSMFLWGVVGAAIVLGSVVLATVIQGTVVQITS